MKIRKLTGSQVCEEVYAIARISKVEPRPTTKYKKDFKNLLDNRIQEGKKWTKKGRNT